MLNEMSSVSALDAFTKATGQSAEQFAKVYDHVAGDTALCYNLLVARLLLVTPISKFSYKGDYYANTADARTGIHLWFP